MLAATARVLRPEHSVEFIDPEAARSGGGTVRGGGAGGTGRRADVVLLKTQTSRALALAARLEACGVPVINSVRATVLCQDRFEVAGALRAAGLPFARTVCATTLGRLVELCSARGTSSLPGFPLMVKSQDSRRHDLVVRVDTPDRLAELASVRRPGEPVIVQEFAPNTGWDHKLWVVDGRLFTARRRSPLAGSRSPDLPVPIAALPAEWPAAALRTGEVLELDVYGVDILDTGGGAALIVDVNAFPGGVASCAGASRALAALALRTADRAQGQGTLR
ncbi:RimK family alpha-L-glutamate ligase [Streptomyces sp. NPDC056517]|uniref:ATP-grasp domain-containing protein n=1 Tax=unclassified Streptomyces TaxID=2593676 RepID=UPI0036BC5A35